MLTIFDLAFYFWAGLLLLIVLILFFLHRESSMKLWYAFVFFSFLAWIQPIINSRSPVYGIGFYGFPLLWIAYTLWRGFPKLLPTPSGFPRQEPNTTQEALQGPRGTQEALTLYFTLAFLILMTGLSVYVFTFSFPWRGWYLYG